MTGIARCYVRVSTGRQERGASLDTQREMIAAYCRLHALTGIWYDDILSGTRDDRPAYTRMVAEIAPGDTIVVWRLDRIGRRKSELFRLFEECKRRRISIVSVTQPDLSNELVRDIMSVLAAYESEQIAERVVPNMAARVEEGRWVSKPPRWYVIGPDKHLAPAPDAADAQRAFDRFLRTRNVEATAVAFGAKVGSMRQYLRNRAYLGEIAWNGIVVPDAHPAIVRRDTWDAVNAILDGRKRTKKRERHATALLTGFLVVANAGRRLYQHTDKRSPYRWYVTHTDDGALPRYSVRAELAEEYAIAQLRTLTITQDQRAEIERDLRAQVRNDPQKRTRQRLARRIATLEGEQVATDRMRARGEIDRTRWERMNREQMHDLAAARAQFAALPPLPDPRAAVPVLDLRIGLDEAIDRAWQARNITALRILLQTFVARIEVTVAPTEGMIGKAAAHWRKNPPLFACVWTAHVHEARNQQK